MGAQIVLPWEMFSISILEYIQSLALNYVYMSLCKHKSNDKINTKKLLGADILLMCVNPESNCVILRLSVTPLHVNLSFAIKFSNFSGIIKEMTQVMQNGSRYCNFF